MTGRPELPDVIRWNDEMVQRYDIDNYYASAHPIVRWIERRRIAALVRLAAAGPGDRVLEVGCGAGHVLEHFRIAGRVGLDLSVEMLGRARRRLGQQVPLLRAGAEALPFERSAFDVVVCTEVLEHTVDPTSVIDELMRVARADGRVVISIPNERNIDRAKRVLRAIPGLDRVLRTLAAEANEWHLHSFDRRLMQSMIADRATMRTIVGVPFDWLPVRYVVLLVPCRDELSGHAHKHGIR